MSHDVMNGYAGHNPDYKAVIERGHTLIERFRPMRHILASAVIGLGLAVSGVLSTLHGNMKPDPMAHAAVTNVQKSHYDVTSATIESVNGPQPAPVMELATAGPTPTAAKEEAAPPQHINRSAPKPKGNTPG
jgi:hypothetical protein